MEETKLITDRKQLQDKLMQLTDKIQEKSQQHMALSIGIGAILQSCNDAGQIQYLVDLSEQIAHEVERAYHESMEIQFLLMGMDN